MKFYSKLNVEGNRKTFTIKMNEQYAQLQPYIFYSLRNAQ